MTTSSTNRYIRGLRSNWLSHSYSPLQPLAQRNFSASPNLPSHFECMNLRAHCGLPLTNHVPFVHRSNSACHLPIPEHPQMRPTASMSRMSRPLPPLPAEAHRVLPPPSSKEEASKVGPIFKIGLATSRSFANRLKG
jgi:hypothetical protein